MITQATLDKTWKLRNADIQAVVMRLLAARPKDLEPLSTRELTALITTKDLEPAVASILGKIAPWIGQMATHDGEEFKAYGRVNRRWRWHGQA